MVAVVVVPVGAWCSTIVVVVTAVEDGWLRPLLGVGVRWGLMCWWLELKRRCGSSERSVLVLLRSVLGGVGMIESVVSVGGEESMWITSVPLMASGLTAAVGARRGNGCG